MLNQQSPNIDEYFNDIKLQNGKTLLTSVSCIDWAVNIPDHFACTLWDGTLKIYQVAQGQNINFRQGPMIIREKASFNVTNPYPLTACTWAPDGNAIFIGTSTGQVKALDTAQGNIIHVGQHQAAINYLKLIPQYGNTLLTSAYERNMHFWNMNNRQTPIKTLNFSNKILRASLNGDIIGTALSNDKIGIASIKALQKLKQNEPSQLGRFSQIQCLQISKDSRAIGLGSIDGRVNISFIQASSTLQYSIKNHITFKGHKLQTKDEITLVPVNSIRFNNHNYEWVSTSGSDGVVNYWNYQTKNKLKDFKYNSTPICTHAISHEGRYMAYALGNDWHIGLEGEKWRPKIAVHAITPEQYVSKNQYNSKK